MTRATVVKLLVGLAVLAAWELVCRAKLISPLILASPSAIVGAFMASGGEFLGAFQVTLASIALATAMAWTVGIGGGLLAGLSPLGYGVFSPFLTALFAVPLITLYPLFVVWFGIGPGSKIAFAFFTGAIPIALNTMEGVRLIDHGYISLAKSLGATRRQAYLRMFLPLALPSILSGLRIGTALVVIGVVVCEMLVATDGIGFWISYNRTLFKTGHVYLGILLALACVALVNFGLGRIERRFDRRFRAGAHIGHH